MTVIYSWQVDLFLYYVFHRCAIVRLIDKGEIESLTGENHSELDKKHIHVKPLGSLWLGVCIRPACHLLLGFRISKTMINYIFTAFGENSIVYRSPSP